MKILTMLQLLQHHYMILSPAGNLAAAVQNIRGLFYEGEITAQIDREDGGLVS